MNRKYINIITMLLSLLVAIHLEFCYADVNLSLDEELFSKLEQITQSEQPVTKKILKIKSIQSELIEDSVTITGFDGPHEFAFSHSSSNWPVPDKIVLKILDKNGNVCEPKEVITGVNCNNSHNSDMYLCDTTFVPTDDCIGSNYIVNYSYNDAPNNIQVLREGVLPPKLSISLKASKDGSNILVIRNLSPEKGKNVRVAVAKIKEGTKYEGTKYEGTKYIDIANEGKGVDLNREKPYEVKLALSSCPLDSENFPFIDEILVNCRVEYGGGKLLRVRFKLKLECVCDNYRTLDGGLIPDLISQAMVEIETITKLKLPSDTLNITAIQEDLNNAIGNIRELETNAEFINELQVWLESDELSKTAFADYQTKYSDIPTGTKDAISTINTLNGSLNDTQTKLNRVQDSIDKVDVEKKDYKNMVQENGEAISVLTNTLLNEEKKYNETAKERSELVSGLKELWEQNNSTVLQEKEYRTNITGLASQIVEKRSEYQSLAGENRELIDSNDEVNNDEFKAKIAEINKKIVSIRRDAEGKIENKDAVIQDARDEGLIAGQNAVCKARENADKQREIRAELGL